MALAAGARLGPSEVHLATGVRACNPAGRPKELLRGDATPGGVVANLTFFEAPYTYAWVVTFGLSFLLYWF